MKILALDLETTGLDTAHDQVLAIGAVLDDYSSLEPLDRLPRFHAVIAHKRVTGSPAALAMNAGLLERIAAGTGMSLENALHDLLTWCINNRVPTTGAGYLNNVVVAGENVWKFDLQMIRAATDKYAGAYGANWVDRNVCHRALDPTTLYTDPYKDTVPPSMRECLRRAGLQDEPYAKSEHDAVDDCLKVLALLRHKWVPKS